MRRDFFFLFLLPAAVAELSLKLGYLYRFSPSNWAVESLSQFKLALKHVNDDPELIPGYNLSFVAYDTLGDHMEAERCVGSAICGYACATRPGADSPVYLRS